MKRLGLGILTIAMLAAPAAIRAQQASVAHIDLMRIWEQGADTQNNMGYLPLAEQRAKTALLHANKAIDAHGDPSAVQSELTQVIAALDPRAEKSGGGGLGLTRAAANILAHMQVAQSRPDASDNVRQRADIVMQSADHVVQKARDAQNLAADYPGGTGDRDTLVAIRDAISAALSGNDADNNGKIEPAEGGLTHIREAMARLIASEGL